MVIPVVDKQSKSQIYGVLVFKDSVLSSQAVQDLIDKAKETLGLDWDVDSLMTYVCGVINDAFSDCVSFERLNKDVEV